MPFAPAFTIDGNGRRGREAGNSGFLMDRGRAGCREEGDIGEARGDETRGRFVLIASDMADSLVRRGWSRQVREFDGCLWRAKEFGCIRGVMYALMSEGRKLWGKRARLLKECYASGAAHLLGSS